MAEDIYIQTTNANGDEISGAYRSSGGIIMVTLSGGTSTRVQRDSSPVEEQAKYLLRQLDCKRQGKP